MTPEIITLITTSSPSLAIVVLFVWYLIQLGKWEVEKEKRQEKVMRDFQNVITKHLEKSDRIQKETNEINQRLTSEVKELSHIIKGLYQRIIEKNKKIQDLVGRKE